MNLKKNPLIIPLILFSIGIIIGNSNALSILAGSLALFFFFLVFQFKTRPNFSCFSLIILYLFLFSGFVTYKAQSFLNEKQHFSQNNFDSLEIRIGDIKQKTNSYAIYAIAKRGFKENRAYPTRGNILIYTKEISGICKGKLYQIPAKINWIECYKNPEVFDYGTFLHLNNINHNSFLENKEFRFERNDLFVFYFLAEIEQKTKSILASTDLSQRHKAFLEAIILGNKDQLSKDTKDQFIHSGIAHLLAVSGMHVGIVLLFMRILLFWVPGFRLKTFLILLIIWIYIVLTGAQIPAIRAGCMISIYLVAFILKRKSNGINAVLFSGLLLLALDPKSLFLVSFQLSFSAMLSILLFYPFIQSFYKSPYKILDGIWNLIALNISVQILVLPVSIYHFGMYSLLGIPLSILSAPLLILIMATSLIALVFDLIIHEISTFFFKLCQKLLDMFFYMLDYGQNLEFDLIVNVELQLPILIAYFFSVLGFYHLVTYPQRSLSFLSISSMPIFIIPAIISIGSYYQKTITVYENPLTTIIDFSSRDVRFRYFEEEISADKSISYYCPPFNGTLVMPNSRTKSKHTMVDSNKIYFNGQSIILDPKEYFKNFDYSVCIFSKRPVQDDALNHCKKIVVKNAGLLLFDNKNQKISKKRVHDLQESGAYILKYY